MLNKAETNIYMRCHALELMTLYRSQTACGHRYTTVQGSHRHSAAAGSRPPDKAVQYSSSREATRHGGTGRPGSLITIHGLRSSMSVWWALVRRPWRLIAIDAIYDDWRAPRDAIE
jgi:hypothetical protein